MNKVGVIGAGFVGTAVIEGFDTVADMREYDKYKETESLDSVVENSDIIFLCLPTPMMEDGECGTHIIEEVSKEIDNIAEESKCLVIKSTVPPYTTLKLSKKYPKHTWVFCPEFLTEKNFIDDFLNQDRIILGLAEKKGHEDNILKLLNLFNDFIKTQKIAAAIIQTTSERAEMLKYMTNAFLATKVMFFNEMYEICDYLNINFDKVRDMVHLDKRIGKSHMEVPGFDGLLGFGGKCLPKDLCALLSFAGPYADLLTTVWAKNLYIREVCDWEEIPGATEKSLKLYNK